MSEKRSMRDRISLFSRVVTIATVLTAVVLLMGILLGWFSFSIRDADTPEDDRFSITLTINTDEFWSSAKEAKDEAVGLKDTISEASDLKTIDGVVMNVNLSTKHVAIAPDGASSETVMVQLDEETEILGSNELSTLKTLSIGDEVSITYVEIEDIKRAKKISRL